jgi:hypothetical protein
MKITVSATYTGHNYSEIELPEGKTWDDVEEFWMNCATFYIKSKNDPEVYGFDIKPDIDMDWSNPDLIRITHENGEELD